MGNAFRRWLTKVASKEAWNQSRLFISELQGQLRHMAERLHAVTQSNDSAASLLAEKALNK